MAAVLTVQACEQRAPVNDVGLSFPNGSVDPVGARSPELARWLRQWKMPALRDMVAAAAALQAVAITSTKAAPLGAASSRFGGNSAVISPGEHTERPNVSATTAASVAIERELIVDKGELTPSPSRPADNVMGEGDAGSRASGPAEVLRPTPAVASLFPSDLESLPPLPRASFLASSTSRDRCLFETAASSPS